MVPVRLQETPATTDDITAPRKFRKSWESAEVLPVVMKGMIVWIVKA